MKILVFFFNRFKAAEQQFNFITQYSWQFKIDVNFILFLYRNHYPRAMEQRNNATPSNCCITNSSIGKRYLDDPECHNYRKYNYSNGPKEIPKYTFQVLYCIATGTFSEPNFSSVQSFFDLERFTVGIIVFFFALLKISVVNNVLRWSIGELKLSFRVNLSRHMYNQYLKWVSFGFYRAVTLLLDCITVRFANYFYFWGLFAEASHFIKCPIWIIEYRMPTSCSPMTLTSSVKVSLIFIRMPVNRYLISSFTCIV